LTHLPDMKTTSLTRQKIAGQFLVTVLTSAGFAFVPQWTAGADALDTWHPRASPLPSGVRLSGVAFGNGRFVAVAYADGHALTSANGATWELHNTGTGGTSKKLADITFGNGIFVAVGAGGHIRTTSDGVQWTPQSADTTANLNGVAFVNDRFLISGDSGALLSSLNGAQWTPHSTANTNRWQSAAYGNGKYVAIGFRTGQAARAAVATTPGDWTLHDTGHPTYMNGVAFGDGMFVSVGYNGALQTSLDGSEWSPSVAAVPGNWLKRVIHEAGHFIAVGETGIAVSPDGNVWRTAYSTGFVAVEGIVFGQNTVLAVGQNGLILQSAPVPISAGVVLVDPVKGTAGFQFQFIGQVGSTYTVQTSTNLTHWSLLGTVPGATPTVTVADPAPAGAQRYYRVLRP
jgi:hypothetical protein